MTTPIYSVVGPDGGAAGGVGTPIEGNDGQMWVMEYPSGIELIFANHGLSSSGVLTPAAWTAGGAIAFNAQQLVDDGSGNLWASLFKSGGHMLWSYFNPNTLAAGTFNIGLSSDINYAICRGPSGDIWGVSLSTDIHRYTPFAGGQTTYTFGGAVFNHICGDATNVYAVDDSGANSAIWVIDSSGAGTKYTPAISGRASNICIGPDGNLWLSTQSGTTLSVYKVSTSGTLLATYAITLPAACSAGNGIAHSDGNVWFSGARVLISVSTSGLSVVWSLDTTGSAVVNTAGAFNGFSLGSGSDGNLYLSGVLIGTTAMLVVEARIAGPPSCWVAVGPPISASQQFAPPQMSLTVNPIAVGDVMVVAVGDNNGVYPPTIAVSGGGVALWVEDFVHENVGGNAGVALWHGVITATGSQTLLVDANGLWGACIVQEFIPPNGTVIADTPFGVDDTTSATSGNYPPITPTATHELFIGVLMGDQTLGGSTAGFTYIEITAAPFIGSFLQFVYELCAATPTVYSPAWSSGATVYIPGRILVDGFLTVAVATEQIVMLVG
jgi:hypothetical protein